MKKISVLLTLSLSVSSAFGITGKQQQEALNQLELARAEIKIVRSLLPGFLKSTIGANLENADERISYAQRVLGHTLTQPGRPTDPIRPVYHQYFCAIASSYDGVFEGRGKTQLEATFNATENCQNGSRSNGYFCQKDSVVCEPEIPGNKFYCVVNSSYDGSFSGRANTKIKAKLNAMTNCRNGSRSNGYFCNGDSDSIKCQIEK